MTQQQDPKTGWFSGWRERREAKRQQARRRAIRGGERASAYQDAAPSGSWFGFGGDGGGG